MRSFSCWQKTAAACSKRCAPGVRSWIWSPFLQREAERWLSVRFPDQDPAAVRRAALECQGLLGRGVELLEGAARRRRPAASRRISWSQPWMGGTSWLCWEASHAVGEGPQGRAAPRLLDQVTAVLLGTVCPGQRTRAVC